MAQAPDKTKIDFSINYSTLIFGMLFTFMAIGLVYFISNSNNYSIEFKDYVSIFTIGVVSTTLFYHSKNVTLTHRYHQERLEFDKEKLNFEKEKIIIDSKRKIAEYSLLVCSEWFRPGISESGHKARVFLNANKGKVKEMSSFIATIENDLESRKAVITMLNYFEHIALLIHREMVDEEIIKDAFKTLFCDYYSLLKPYIKERQSESRRFLMLYEALAEKWSKN